MTANRDTLHFINVRKDLTDLRETLARTGQPLNDVDRDFAMLAQAEALCDLAATLNAGISVSTD